MLFPKWAFEELMSLPEGKGGSFLIKNHPERVASMAVADQYELMDADTPETLRLLRQAFKLERE